MVDTTVKKEGQIAEKQVASIVVKVAEIKIKNDDDLTDAVSLLSEVKASAKAIANKKDSIIRPLNVSIKEIRDLFREPESKLSAAEAQLKKSILDYQRKVQEKAEKKAAKIEAKHEAGEITTNQAMNQAAKIKTLDKTVKSDNGGVQFKTLRKVRIVNIAEIPSVYFTDSRVLESLRLAVSKDALAVGETGIVIPGVEVYEEKTVAGV